MFARSDARIDGLLNTAVAAVSFRVVGVDIRPDSPLNVINLRTRGVVPVAILGSELLDVTDVATATPTFGPEGAEPGASPFHAKGGHRENVNDDGFLDLVSHYDAQEAGIEGTDTRACITGELLDGTAIDGCDTILIVGACGLGFELVLLLPPLTWLRGRARSRASSPEQPTSRIQQMSPGGAQPHG